MKPSKYLAVFSLLNALALCFNHSRADAGQGNTGAHRSGQAASHMSTKGSANSNAQWSADPERGWVRAEERHQLHEQSQGTTKTKQNRGKHKGNTTKAGKQ